MNSISSGTAIRERTRFLCQSREEMRESFEVISFYDQLNHHLKKEYGLIPSKERIGKGIVYISRYVAKELYSYFSSNTDLLNEFLPKYSTDLYDIALIKSNTEIQHLAILIFAEFIKNNSRNFLKFSQTVEKYATSDNWSIRETACSIISYSLKGNTETILSYLEKLSQNPNENLRRLASESLRPTSDNKWLRDKTKNMQVLRIISKMKYDPSLYVRKSVANNLKDLTKYMPETILDLFDKWVLEAKIKVRDDLVSEKGLNSNQKRLLWVIKFALRWIKTKKPEFNDRIIKILGKNYILYYDEKSNKLGKSNKIR